MASTQRTALAKAPGVRMSRGFTSSQTICTMRSPAARTSAIIFRLSAATGALPGKAMPSASQTICIEFAVPSPEHTPGLRMASRLMPISSSTGMLPVTACIAPTNTSSMSTCLPLYSPLAW
jgi:hypothetical protein